MGGVQGVVKGHGETSINYQPQIADPRHNVKLKNRDLFMLPSKWYKLYFEREVLQNTA